MGRGGEIGTTMPEVASDGGRGSVGCDKTQEGKRSDDFFGAQLTGFWCNGGGEDLKAGKSADDEGDRK